jgi:hypothetical protein
MFADSISKTPASEKQDTFARLSRPVYRKTIEQLPKPFDDDICEFSDYSPWGKPRSSVNEITYKLD